MCIAPERLWKVARMPELFGSAYILPAIIVVVLLLVLFLALMRSRRAKAPKPERVAPAKERGRPEADADSPNETRDVSEVAAATEPSPGMTTARAMRSRKNAPRLGQHARRWETTTASTTAAVSTDPVTPVLMELLHGWGDLSQADKNRLNVFRPSVVQAAARGLQMPKELKNDRDAHVRLEQLVRYADDLAVAHAPATDPLGSRVHGLEEEDTAFAGAPQTDVAPLAVPLAETTQEMRLVPPPGAHVSPDVTDEAAAHLSRDAEGAADDLDATQIAGAAAAGAAGLVSMTNGGRRTVSTDHEDGERADLDAFVHSRAGRVAPTPAEGDILQTPQSADAEPEHSSFDIAFGRWEEVSPPTVQEVSAFGEWSPLDDTVETQPKPRPLLGDVVRTADDLLALPAEEQAEMVAFLEPGELAGVLKRTDDPALKKAVIDTLEHVNSPAALEVLRQCLDDSDPQVQMHALQAADRILGSR